MAKPIWKDYYVTLGTADSVDFRITCDGEVIYVGRSHRRPSENANKVRINNIVADYLAGNGSISGVIGIQTLLGGVWDTIAEETFTNDWSYDYDYDPATMGMSFPINGHIAYGQWVIYSLYSGSSIQYQVTKANGSISTITVQTGVPTGLTGSSFEEAVGDNNVIFKVADTNARKMTIGGREYRIVGGCHRYALYYQNAYGGWDTFLIEGNHLQEDSLTRHTREAEYDNRNIGNRGRVNYVNEIDKSFTFHTSWLNDEQSSRMHHLLNATNVFLYDIAEEEMIPVILENTGTQHKTYKNNGAKLVNYEIKVTIAQERMRR